MPDIVRAMSMAAAILLGVVILITLMAVAAVKRGEMMMHGSDQTKAWWNFGLSGPAAGGAMAAKAQTIAEISVLQILLVGTGIFVLAVLFLFGVSVLGHL